jgi:hypothetical protein
MVGSMNVPIRKGHLWFLASYYKAKQTSRLSTNICGNKQFQVNWIYNWNARINSSRSLW